MPQFARTNTLDDPVLQDGDTAFLRMNARLRPNQLQPGEVALSENGRMETDQNWRPRPPIRARSGALLDENTTAAITKVADSAGALTLIADTTITAASLTSNVVTVTAAGHGLPSAHTSVININGVAFTTTDPNGNREVTYVDDDNFTFPLTGGNETYTITSGELARSFILATAQTEVYASCILSDPADSNEDYILIATDSLVRAYKLSSASNPLAETEVTLPAAATVSGPAEIVQAFDKVYLFRKGDTALVWDFDLSGGSHAFAEVPSGGFTQPDELEDTTATIGTDGKVSMNVTTHGLTTGDRVKVISVASGIELTEGDMYTVTRDNDNNFHFFADIDDTGTGSAIIVRKRVSEGGGYIHMPGAEFGTYFQRRFFVPYTHTSASPPVDREIQDELIASDILDPDTFDPINNQFRITSGSADHIVAIHPFNDDNLIVGCRNSIHVVKAVSGSLNDASVVELTREIGVVARKSIVTYANQVIFLSDNGVYSVSFIDEYNLRGTELPLSEAIQPYIDRINTAYAHKAAVTYHDNRYYLAVPLDSSTGNSHILVYNFLNGGWESVDFTGSSNFEVQDFAVARSGQYNELYIVTTLGGIHLLDSESNNDLDELISTISDTGTNFAIPSDFKSRQYTFGNLERKKFHRADLHIKSAANTLSDGNISVMVEDPDSTTALRSINSDLGADLPAGEGATLRQRIGNVRGYGAQIHFTPTSGRPALRLLRLEAVVDYRSTTSTQ